MSQRKSKLKTTSWEIPAETKESLKTVQFDVWKYDNDQMLLLLEEMYHNLDLVCQLKIHPDTLKRFLLTVAENYRTNPFHNFRHCFCVTQMMYVTIHQCNLDKYLTSPELCVLITSCICHDLDHPGFSNTYQVNAKTELAVRYDGISPLENHHNAVCLRILDDPDCNLFAAFSPEDQRNLQADISMLILATDMARHSEILEDFNRKSSAPFNFRSRDHLKSLKMILIKACDVSNECRPIPISEPWVECLLEEYFHQSDTEKQKGLPYASFMDRDKVTKSSAQVNFIRHVLLPLFESLAKVLPQVREVFLDNLVNALAHYQSVQEDEKR